MAPEAISEQVFEDLDKEPNDTMIQATDVTLTGDEFHYTGKLTPGDIDTWRIKAKAGTIVDIAVTPENFDVIADFAPIDKDSARRYYDENPAGQPETLTNLRLTPQGGYLTVRGRNTEDVTYTVTITRLTPKGDEILEQEPNDSLQAAQPLWTDRELNASLNPSDDVDFYKLNLNTPGILSCVFPAEPVSVKFVQNNQVIATHRVDSGVPFKSQPLQASGDLFVQIERLTPLKAPARYSCRLTALDAIPNEIEPNNTLDTAQKMSLLDDNKEFSFLNTSDIDMFRVSTDAGAPRRYTARIESDANISTLLSVMDSQGAPLMQSTGSQACFFSVTPGSDFVLRAAHAPTTNPYPVSYKLRISSFEADAVESEPNNMITQATPITLAKPISGYIFPNSDIDFYRIDVPATPTSTSGKLDVTTEPGYISMLSIRLQDSAGFEISRAESATASKPISLSFDAPAGTYYPVVSGQGDQCMKPYTLTINYTPSEEAMPHAADAAATAALAAIQAEVPSSAPSAPQPNDPAAPTSPSSAADSIPVPAAPAPDATTPQPQPPQDVDINALPTAASQPDPPSPAPDAHDDDTF